MRRTRGRWPASASASQRLGRAPVLPHDGPGPRAGRSGATTPPTVSRWLVMPDRGDGPAAPLQPAAQLGQRGAAPATRCRRRRARPSPAGGSAGGTPGTTSPPAAVLVEGEGADPGGAGVDGDDHGHGPTVLARSSASVSGRPGQRAVCVSTDAGRHPDRRGRLPRAQRGHPRRRAQGRAAPTATTCWAPSTAGGG